MSPASPLEIVARIPGVLAHSWCDEGLICSRLNELCVLPDLAHPKLQPVARLPWNPLRSVARIRLADRVLKFGILHAQKTGWGYTVAMGQAWWHVEGRRAVRVDTFSSTRPMLRGVCTGVDGSVFVADYRLNRRRRAVRIFQSRDGRRFDVAWEFAPGNVRHVHALCPDTERPGRIWVLTGDRDTECGIYFTDDGFRTLGSYAQGAQDFRATDLVTVGGSLFWGMDSPNEPAHMIRAPRTDPARRERLFALPGPAYYLVRNENGGLYVSTAAEPGRAVLDRRAHVFRCLHDARAEELLGLRRDWLPQHGMVCFPRGVLPRDFLVFVPRAVRPHEGCLTIARDRLWG